MLDLFPLRGRVHGGIKTKRGAMGTKLFRYKTLENL